MRKKNRKALASGQVITYVAHLLYKFNVYLSELNGRSQVFFQNQHDTLAFVVAVPKTGRDYLAELTRTKNVDICKLKLEYTSSNSNATTSFCSRTRCTVLRNYFISYTCIASTSPLLSILASITATLRYYGTAPVIAAFGPDTVAVWSKA
jgi:hypothetical protein